MSARSFVVLFLGRSGSTYLMEALGDHPEVDAGFEELGSRRQSGASAQLEYARSFFTSAREAPIAAAGFKTKLQDVLDREGFGALLQEQRARVIVLQRRNVVKAVVSWFRSEIVNDATGDWNVYRKEDRPPPVRLDPAEFGQRVKAYERARAELQRYASHLERPTLVVYYEDLLEDAAATFRSVCGFLGVSEIPLRGRALKATPDDLRLAVKNVDELRASLDARYRPMFDERTLAGPA